MRWASLKALACWIGLTATAQASETALYAGLGGVFNDPFLKRNILSAGIQVRPQVRFRDQPTVAFGADAWFAPNIGDTDWKALTKTLIEEMHVSPDISKITFALRANAVIYPGKYTNGSIETKVGIGTSFGFVRTTDDIEALDSTDQNERAVVTQHQIHPCSGLMLVGEIWRDNLGLRLRLDNVAFIEGVNATTLEYKGNSALLVDLMVIR